MQRNGLRLSLKGDGTVERRGPKMSFAQPQIVIIVRVGIDARCNDRQIAKQSPIANNCKIPKTLWMNGQEKCSTRTTNGHPISMEIEKRWNTKALILMSVDLFRKEHCDRAVP